jgi:arylsulfatase A-like enzyme
MGYDRPTSPNIDSLAAEGAVFENAFSQANGTTWSVPSYFTGRFFPVYCLDRGSWEETFRKRPERERYLPEILREHGYTTHMITAHGWFSSNSRIWKAFDSSTYLPPGRGEPYADFGAINTDAFRWLEEHSEQPFFLYIHSIDTHFPHDRLQSPYDQWLDPGYTAERIRNPLLQNPPFDDREQHHLRGQHDGSILFADAHIGQLIQQLQYLGVYDNTIVIISSDHGDLLGEDGKTFDHPSGISSHELFHVPLIFRGPGITPGQRVSALAQNADIVPTLVDLLQLATDAAMDGLSLVPLFDPQSGIQTVHEYAFAKRPSTHDGEIPVIMLRDRFYHYESNFVTGKEFLWQTPDRIAERTNVIAAFPDVARRMHDHAAASILPLWEQYAALPQTEVGVFTVKLESASVPVDYKDAWVGVAQHSLDDNKWTLTSGRLKSCAFRENAPPIRFDLSAPNGEYEIQIELDGSLGSADQFGAAIAVQAQGEAQPRVLRSDDPDAPRKFVGLGEFTIADQSFTLTIDEGDPTKWAVAGAVRFIPLNVDIDRDSLDSQSERDEQLRALGYLGD